MHRESGARRRLAAGIGGGSRPSVVVQWLTTGPCVLSQGHAFAPPVDVYETDTDVVVKMELAGVSRESISVTVEGDLIRLAGERRDTQAGGQRVYHQLEISYGSFQRSLRLPAPVASDQATAKYDQGFLIITLPRQRPARPDPTAVPIA